MKVLLLLGGTSNEREVSLRSGRAISNSLTRLGYEVIEADPAAANFDLEKLAKEVDIVFPALHGEGGEDGTLQEQLEALGVAFVGSGSKASKLCWDKWEYKRFLADQELPVSDGKIITTIYDNAGAPIEEVLQPFVLKPSRGGSSLDTVIAHNPTDKDRIEAEQALKKYPSGMLLEPLIDGTEITVGIFNDKPLPVIEIVPPEGATFDYENKYNGKTQELCPPETVSEDLQRQAQDLALKIHQLTGCRHISRTDIIIDKTKNLWVLETNTIPGMTEQSLLPKMLSQSGSNFEQFVDQVIKQTI